MKQFSLYDEIGISQLPHPHNHRAMRSSFYRKYGKYMLDIGIILISLPILLPVFLMLMVMASRDGGGPFFIQNRIGKGGEHFRCFKFRTMVPNAEAKLQELLDSDPEVKREWDLYQKIKNDPRITRAGRILRSTSLDELPQLLNVIKGEMSLVGPRPFTRGEQERYIHAGGWSYFEMKPGVTGLWQVIARNSSKVGVRHLYDNRYYRQMSLWTDLKIIFMTFGVVLKRTGQ